MSPVKKGMRRCSFLMAINGSSCLGSGNVSGCVSGPPPWEITSAWCLARFLSGRYSSAVARSLSSSPLVPQTC